MRSSQVIRKSACGGVFQIPQSPPRPPIALCRLNGIVFIIFSSVIGQPFSQLSHNLRRANFIINTLFNELSWGIEWPHSNNLAAFRHLTTAIHPLLEVRFDYQLRTWRDNYEAEHLCQLNAEDTWRLLQSGCEPAISHRYGGCNPERCECSAPFYRRLLYRVHLRPAGPTFLAVWW